MFNYENSSEPVASAENGLGIKYFNMMVNEIKSNLQTQFESFAKSVHKFCFVFAVSNLKEVKRTFRTLPRFENCLICR
jgi:hypothetical protein